MQIVGLDLSLTATGIARLTINGEEHALQLDTITSEGRKGATYGDRAGRLRTIARQVLATALPADLVVIEGPAYGSASPSTWDRAGLWWDVALLLEHRGVPFAVVAPSTLKKYATGSGAATKPDMRMALFQRLGTDVRDDNQVDAGFLALAGAQHLGTPVLELPARNVAALERADWPDPTDAAEGGSPHGSAATERSGVSGRVRGVA